MSGKVVRIYRGVVLIADDDPLLREALEDILKKRFKGISVIHAGDGDEALDIIYSEPPSLLILNMVMPRKRGDEVLRNLSKSEMRLPILVISGYFKSKGQVAAAAQVSEEFFEFMNKPFPTGEFLSKVEALLLRRCGGKPY